MPRVHYVRANKDYPNFKIKKGDMHYVWSLFRSRPQRSLTRPTRAQLTGSEFLATYYTFVDTDLPQMDSDEALRELATNVRQHAEEEEGKIQDMPENFQQGPNGERCQNRADELNAWADEIESAADDLGSESDFNAEESGHESYADAVAAAIEELEGSAPDPE